MTASITAAAIAAYEANPLTKPTGERVPWEALSDELKATYRLRIRAAFAAIRVPSPGMLEAGEAQGITGEIWTAMVDAMLSEAE